MDWMCRDGEQLAKIAKFCLRTVVVQHERYDGTQTEEFKRVIFDRGDSVGVLLYDRNTREVIMTEQFRVGVAANGTDDPWVIETVAGSMDVDGEDPLTTGLREVEEEAPGCRIVKVFHINSYYPSPGACSEKMHLFCGLIDSSNADASGGLAEHNEDIKVLKLPIAEAITNLQVGTKFNTSTALISLYWLKDNLEQLDNME